MEIETLLILILNMSDKYPIVGYLATIMGILGSLSTVATVVVASTKTTKDDEILGKMKNHPVGKVLFKVIDSLSLVRAKNDSEHKK